MGMLRRKGGSRERIEVEVEETKWDMHLVIEISMKII